MNKKITLAIFLTVLALSLSVGVVTAKRPNKPLPGTALFELCVYDDLKLTNPHTLKAAGPVTRWHPDDIYTTPTGGDVADNPEWYFTHIGFGYFDTSGVEGLSEWYTNELAEVMGLEHYRYFYDETTGSYLEDFWVFVVKWNKEVVDDPLNPGPETLYLVFRTSRDSALEGEFFEENELGPGTGETWRITFTSENTDRAYIYYGKVVSGDPIGNSGKFHTKTEFVELWHADDPFSFTVQVEKE